MERPITGTVVEMDISHMRAAIAIDDESVVDAKVGRIYNIGEGVIIYNIQDLIKPWYLQGEEWIDKQPISGPEMMRGSILRGIKVG